jgi:hypothetical protein
MNLEGWQKYKSAAAPENSIFGSPVADEFSIRLFR